MFPTMTLPRWVTKDLLQTQLQRYLEDPALQVRDVSSKAAVPVGDNYTSDLFRVQVDYTGASGAGSVSLIVKCAPENGRKLMLATEIHLFEKEALMMNETIPKLHKILGEKCFAADCLLAEDSPHGLLVLQDLTPLGYRMAERQEGLDLQHCFLVLERLAKWHAASVILHQQEPQSMDEYTRGIYANQQDNKVIEHFAGQGFRSLKQAAKNWPSCRSYADKLNAISEGELFTRTVQSASRRPGEFCVLNHGDLWSNNMLFKYNAKGRLEDLKFVDFQLAVFSSPAVDLQYFMHTSPADQVRSLHENRLVEYYHERLSATLSTLGYPLHDIPDLGEIRRGYLGRSFYGLVSAATVLPLVRAPARKDATYEDLVNDDTEDGFRYGAYNSKEYRTVMEDLLPSFDKLGLLELNK